MPSASGRAKKMMKRILLTLLLGVITGIAVWYGINPMLKKHEPITTFPVLTSATVFPVAQAQPIAAFSLTDTMKKVFTEHDLVGGWTLLFFGYAHCPEICPRSMAIASNFWKKLSVTSAVKKPRFIFITLDPKQDTVEELKAFLKHFNSEFIGLTGDAAEIDKLAKSCRVYSWEDPNPNDQGQKIIDHTAAFILVNPEGRIQALFSPPHDSETIAKDLATLIEKRSPVGGN